MPVLPIINAVGKFLKALPYLLLTGIIVFGVLKLQSCSGGLSESKQALQLRLDNQKQINAILKEGSKDNIEALSAITKSSQVSLESVVKQTSDEKKINNDAGVREISVKKQLATVLSNYNASPKSLAASSKKDLQISTVQINSIWSSYCSDSPTEDQCKAAS